MKDEALMNAKQFDFTYRHIVKKMVAEFSKK